MITGKKPKDIFLSKKFIENIICKQKCLNELFDFLLNRFLRYILSIHNLLFCFDINTFSKTKI